MNAIFSFGIEVALTLLISMLLVRYLQPFMLKVLLDLCAMEERARFWTVFSNILLIGVPLIFALNYMPRTRNPEELFFDITSKLSGNLGGLLLALIGVGLMISLFALMARRPREVK